MIFPLLVYSDPGIYYFSFVLLFTLLLSGVSFLPDFDVFYGIPPLHPTLISPSTTPSILTYPSLIFFYSIPLLPLPTIPSTTNPFSHQPFPRFPSFYNNSTTNPSPSTTPLLSQFPQTAPIPFHPLSHPPFPTSTTLLLPILRFHHPFSYPLLLSTQHPSPFFFFF